MGGATQLGGLRLRVEGVVQGVGFRPHVLRWARRLGVTGAVWNDGCGVVLDAYGSAPALEALRRRLVCGAPGSARVARVTVVRALAAPGPAGFEICESRGADTPAPAAGGASLSPDLATCPACRAELFDPASRRHAYPFTTCTRCGPRYTVVYALPYDRERTTLRRFRACAACRREYREPGDRRLHAQSLACPDCGPRLSYLETGADAPAAAHGERALGRALALLRAGGIVALQGLGGFHLACDAMRADAVARLRKRKRRERKPLAVMVRSLAAAEALAVLGAGERALLTSPEAPIVLAPLRPDAELAPGVAPDLPRVGLLLPYTPLHHLLLCGFGGPLVMTSGNRSGEPLGWRVPEALDRLAGIADGFLAHDRDIAAPCDDSVAQVVAGAPQLLRRARGFVPRPLRLEHPVPEPILGVGGQLHSAIALAVGRDVVLGAHGGDLESPEAVAAFEEGVERLERLLGVRARRVAHDLHPAYASTRYAEARGASLVGVQHHHAHLASVLAECRARGPALGLVWDGTGLGTDGHAWGGELLLGDARGFERLGTLRPLRLAGGERAIRSVWRQGLAVLEDAFDGEPPAEALALLGPVGSERVESVRELLRKDVACVRAHGAGRWFDAVGALVLGCSEATWSGEVATRLGFTARGVGAPYPYSVSRPAEGAAWEVDLRPMVRELVAERVAGCPAPRIAARFHATLAAAAAALVEHAGARHRDLPVALSGGCFQNPLLVERICAQLSGRRVLRHREVPCGDGGLALGQVCVAAAALEGGEA